LAIRITNFRVCHFWFILCNKPVNQASIEALKGGETIFFRVLNTVKIFLFIMIFNLIIHIVLRGLWIGALGLRYVSGEIDYDNLNYSEKFTNYLKKKVGSFDNYIWKVRKLL